MPRYSGLLGAQKIISGRLQEQEKLRGTLATTLLGKMLVPEEWKPRTQEQALEFERAKAGMKGKPTKWDIQKEARTTVNAMINQNPELQMSVFENPNLLTDLIDKEVQRLSQQYGLLQEGIKSIPKNTQREALITQYMKKYPNRSREEIINAMDKQGL